MPPDGTTAAKQLLEDSERYQFRTSVPPPGRESGDGTFVSLAF